MKIREHASRFQLVLEVRAVGLLDTRIFLDLAGRTQCLSVQHLGQARAQAAQRRKYEACLSPVETPCSMSADMPARIPAQKSESTASFLTVAARPDRRPNTRLQWLIYVCCLRCLTNYNGSMLCHCLRCPTRRREKIAFGGQILGKK